MQSTGHSSMHALSLISTQGSAIVYVTKVSSTPVRAAGWFSLFGLGEEPPQVCVAQTWTPVSVCPNFARRPYDGWRAWLLILDVADTSRPVATPAADPMLCN